MLLKWKPLVARGRLSRAVQETDRLWPGVIGHPREHPIAGPQVTSVTGLPQAFINVKGPCVKEQEKGNGNGHQAVLYIPYLPLFQ